MHKSHIDHGWLDPVLARHLCRVAAPAGLSTEIQTLKPVSIGRKHSLRLGMARLSIACTMLILAAGGIIHLRDGNKGPDLHSDRPMEIRAWVKARTGIDLPLPDEPSPQVRLMSACAVKGGSPVIEVAYRVKGRNATLRVAKALSTDPITAKHQFLKCEEIGGERVSTWVMRGQRYSLIYASLGDSRDECLLCHTGS